MRLKDKTDSIDRTTADVKGGGWAERILSVNAKFTIIYVRMISNTVPNVYLGKK